MPQFNSVAELEAYIKAAINDTLQNEVADTATEAMIHNINEVVYDYTPAMYKRRGSGGLGSPESINTTLIGDGVLEVEDVAESSPSVVDGSVSNQLASWIINGDVPNIFNGNDGYPWMYPRDFVAATAEDSYFHRMLKDAVVHGMSRNGLKVK